MALPQLWNVHQFATSQLIASLWNKVFTKPVIAHAARNIPNAPHVAASVQVHLTLDIGKVLRDNPHYLPAPQFMSTSVHGGVSHDCLDGLCC